MSGITKVQTSEKNVPKVLLKGTRIQRPSRLPFIVGMVLAAITLIGIFLSSSNIAVGVWSLVLMLLLMFLSVPVAIALSIPSIIGLFAISGPQAVTNLISNSPFNAVSSWSMSVLPMFIFMGMLLSESGIISRLYRATARWFSWLPGGLGIGTVAAGAALASASGSTIGMTYALGRAGIPEMLRAGYSKKVAVGTILLSGLPGNLIPPSILLVVYAGIASVPIGSQLVAGIVPGVLVVLLVGTVIFSIGVFAPKLVGRSSGNAVANKTVTWADRFQSLKEIWSLPLVMFVLFGGMFSGAFTPTEAGAAAALLALLLTIFYTRQDKPMTKVVRSASATVTATAAIFFILIGAEMLTRLLAVTGLAPRLTDFITGLGLSRTGFLMVLIVVYLVMGMFFETLSMMLLTIPILLPTLELLEISPIWFGVFVVLLGEMAMITPPVGILSYVVYSISRSPEVNLGHKITLNDIFSAVLWFLPIPIAILFIMIFVPEMVDWLPELLQSAENG